VPESKVVIIPNGSNTDIFQPDPDGGDCLRTELGLDGKFVAIYGGIFGIAQDLETLIEAARLLADQPDIRIVFVGEGPQKEELVALKEDYGLTNVLTLPGQPLERMPAYLSMADVALVPLRKVNLFLGARPTKMFDAWACQTPTLITVDGEAREVLEEVGAGIFVEPENPQALANALLRLRDTPDSLAQMGLAGHRAVVEQYSLRVGSRQIEVTFREVTGE
jgi:glycosyltransferase involved in cell wall biosynthesis